MFIALTTPRWLGYRSYFNMKLVINQIAQCQFIRLEVDGSGSNLADGINSLEYQQKWYIDPSYLTNYLQPSLLCQRVKKISTKNRHSITHFWATYSYWYFLPVINIKSIDVIKWSTRLYVYFNKFNQYIFVYSSIKFKSVTHLTSTNFM